MNPSHAATPAAGPAPLALTAAAEEAIRLKLAELDAEGPFAFFVVTQPSRLGYNIGVGFERRGGERPLREEYAVPLQVDDEDLSRLRGTTIDYRDERFVTFTDVSVHLTETPNPDSRKFILNRELVVEGSATFAPPGREEDPLLARYLLEVPGVKALFFIRNFCTVTKVPGAEWPELQTEIGRRLQGYFAHGGGAMTPPPRNLGEMGDVERRIFEVLEEVVRPAVQRDGGDIAFAGFENGVVQLYMLGSCSGCPSALATLKMGVETLLKDMVPEVTEVVAIG